MEEKKDYNLCLIGDDVRDQFLEDIKDQYEIISIPEYIPQVLRIRLSASEREELLKNIYVIEIEEEKEAFPASVSFSGKTITVAAPSPSEVGSDYASAVHKYMTNGTNVDGTLGLKGDRYQPRFAGGSYTSELSGEHVDIVSLEVTDSMCPFNYHNSHAEWRDPDTNVTRCFPMDWSQYNSSLQETFNTSQNGYMLTRHAAGVLSAAGGVVGGLAKKASLRVIYSTGFDSLSDVYNAIISWHNSKSTNPVTGKKNPTIVIGEYQPLLSNGTAIEISQIASINYRGTTINRPPSDRNAALNGWYLSDFIQYNMIPKKLFVSGEGYKWVISFSPFSQNLTEKSNIESLVSNGIHFICAAGNDCGVYSKYNSDDYDNSITTDSSFREYSSLYNYKYTQVSIPRTYFVHRAFGPNGIPDAIDVAAYQRSEATPALDGYSTRGPGIDISGLGVGTWTAYPGATYSEGDRYGIFSGTSSATPTVVGVAACMLEYYYKVNGSYPNPATLKNLLLGNAINRIQNYPTINWNTLPTPDPNTQVYADNLVDNTVPALDIPGNRSAQNGLPYATDLVGTTSRSAFLPDFMRTYSTSTGGPIAPSPPAPCTPVFIQGPTGLQPSPPYNYAQTFTGWREGRGGRGLYITPNDDPNRDRDISYVAFRLRFRSFGPRRDTYSGGEGSYNFRFIPFRINFTLRLVCDGDGAYRSLYLNTSHDWYNFEYKDIDFQSSDLAIQNGLPRDGDKLIFPDFATKNYQYPRITEIKSDIINLDNGEKNRINMFAIATDDQIKARENIYMEYGKYIIT